MRIRHTQRYVDAFAGRYGIRNADTVKEMGSVVAGTVGKRLMDRALVGQVLISDTSDCFQIQAWEEVLNKFSLCRL